MTTTTVLRCSADAVELPPRSVRTIVTSPPYWGKRTYGDDPLELGSGQTLLEYVQSLTLAARRWRTALTDDGTLWVNIGDTYAGSGGAGGDHINGSKQHIAKYRQGAPVTVLPYYQEILPYYRGQTLVDESHWGMSPGKLAGGQLCLVPALLAMHLQGDGWIVRSMIVWDRGHPRPEALGHVRRPGDGQYEHIIMATKSMKYFFNPGALPEGERGAVWKFRGGSSVGAGGRNGHVAPFPDELPRRCIELSSEPGDTVFDPFLGSGTTARVANELGRNAVGCDLYAGDDGFASTDG